MFVYLVCIIRHFNIVYIFMIAFNITSRKATPHRTTWLRRLGPIWTPQPVEHEECAPPLCRNHNVKFNLAVAFTNLHVPKETLAQRSGRTGYNFLIESSLAGIEEKTLSRTFSFVKKLWPDKAAKIVLAKKNLKTQSWQDLVRFLKVREVHKMESGIRRSLYLCGY